MPDVHTPETCEACARAAEWAAETRAAREPAEFKDLDGAPVSIEEIDAAVRGCCHLCGANAEQACAAPSARLTFYNVQCPRKR